MATDDKGTVLDKSLVAQGVTDDLDNKGKTGADTGNPAPAEATNEPPAKPEPTDDEKALAAKEAEVKATKEADEKAAADLKAEADKDATPLDVDAWGTTGDEVADSVLTMLQNADVSPEEAKALLYDAVQAGDVSKIDKAALEAKVGKTKATLIMAGVTNFVDKRTADNSATLDAVHKAAGGEENWTKIAAWGKDNLPESDLADYRGMIDKGGAQARFAVQEIAAKFNADEGNTTLSGATAAVALEGDGGVGKTARSTTRAEYVAELTKAHRGNATEAVLNEITAARHRGRAAGL